ncbi:DOPA 4,5-dioxygenase family protein [Pigmentiphaga litoralis]|uniref:DOPA 4,5-dioxygenase n=1 Tax=Pigmentiphaga litoralis TaxID=516702 RepID=A0A7Y9IU88_9BURK|nr:DOPA 4,5-dioxygenase family protein [Pigmentiphaga litoralis]NYE23987.1 DOPA 4,5-dioxygenase [Pigmentiphaga litoralis]NYE82399.1 DOPA 4,5-dioxygenase [Pigmentiphaga litoralis]
MIGRPVTPAPAAFRPMPELPDPAAIREYHAHIYYDPAATRDAAARLRDAMAERFEVRLGRWHDVPVGPHTAAMYQALFAPALFATFVPWLMLNRDGLDILVHPDTGWPRRDHLSHGIWLGQTRAIKGERLPERDGGMA